MLFIIIGLVSGVLSSMGLGGGVVLIPLLSLLGIEQKEAQVINIFVFVIMVVFLLITESQKQYIDIFSAIILGLLGGVASFISSLFVKDLDSASLKIIFGIFLIAVALIETCLFIRKNLIKNKNSKSN